MNKVHLFALGAFLVGVTGVQVYAHQLRKELRGGEPVEVVLVTQDLKPGAILSEENFTTMAVPSDYVDPRRVHAKDSARLLGAELALQLRAGDGIVWSDLTDGEAAKHLAAIVAPGMRAYSLEAKANPLGGLLRVGDRVDVLLEARGETELLVERLLVLAVGGKLERSDAAEGNHSRSEGVTVSVTVEQAEELLEGEARGELRLVLRNAEDRIEHRKNDKGDSSLAAPSRGRPSATVEKKEIEHVH